MALVTLPNLYARPSDVYDYLSTEATQLRLDDNTSATGKTLQMTALAAIGATSLTIAPCPLTLLPGTTLLWDGGGLDSVVTTILTSTALLGTTTLLVAATDTALPPLATARDNGVNSTLAARLVKGCSYGTSQVKLYCCARYDDSMLATCWSANRWATMLAARWVCKRLARACPQGIKEDCEEALKEMEMIRGGVMQLEDVPTRTSGFPFVTNVTVDLFYTYTRVRVEPQTSEGTPTQYGQFIDWNAALMVEYW